MPQKANIAHVVGLVKTLILGASVASSLRDRRSVETDLWNIEGGVSEYLSIQFDRHSRASDASLNIDFRRGKVAVTWSSTERSVVEALAAVSLYNEVVALAATVEACLDSYDITDAP